MNNFIPYGNVGNNMNMPMNNNLPQFNPYQEKVNRFNNLQQQNNQQQPNTNMNFIMVENIQKAKEQIVPYGYTMWMRDASEPYQYIKSVDQVGTPKFTVLKVEDVTETMNNDTQQNTFNDNYVSLEQYNKLNSTVEQLQKTVDYYSDMINKIVSSKDSSELETKQTKKMPTNVKKVGDNNG